MTHVHFHHREQLARLDERVKSIEQRLQRRWDVLLVLAGALVGMIATLVGNILLRAFGLAG